MPCSSRSSWRTSELLKAVTGAVLLLAAARPAWATPEYIQSGQTAPGSVDQSLESTEHAFRLPVPMRVFSRLGEVFRESMLDVQLRNYYFQRVRDGQPNSQAWAQGGELAYATPWWKSRLRLGASLYTSQRLYGPADKDGTLLLKPVQQGFSVLGQAYLETRPYGQSSLRVYRQTFELPYLNRDDSRMVPNTFESVSLFEAAGEHLAYALAHTWRMKKRDATRFVSMTEAAGIEGPDRALSTAGARYTFADGINIGAINHYSQDYMNIFYTEFNSRTRMLKGVGFQLSAQYTRQHSVGDELDGDFDARSRGAKLAASYAGLVVNLAYTETANNSGIRSNWGGRPGFLSLMIQDFDRAGEDAWLVGLSTDFSHFGANPFSGFINYARGTTPDRGSKASADQSELDVTLDYRPVTGRFKGLWLRLRGAFVDQEGKAGSDLRDIRLIANYDFSVL